MYENDDFEADDFIESSLSSHNSPIKPTYDSSNSNIGVSNSSSNNNTMSNTQNIRMETLLVRIEDYLLPTSDNLINKSKKTDIGDNIEFNEVTPRKKLFDLCYQITLADHIRNSQTIYKDMYDELNLVNELRVDKVRMTTNYLNDKIYEGRVRIKVLVKLCYGEDSIEYLRSELDLAYSYAQQGLWLQVNEVMTNLLTHLIYLQSKNSFNDKLKVNNKFSHHISERIALTYNILRLHATKHRGQVTMEFVSELEYEFNKLEPISNDINNINEFLIDQSKELCLSLKNYISNFKSSTHNTNYLSTPTWGNIITFLRYYCSIMKLWLVDLESGILPQTKSLLQLAIYLCDLQKRGVVHPAQFCNYMTTIPNINKIILGTNIIKQLMSKKVEVTLYISSHTSDIIDINNNNLSTNDMNSISYELPITSEEIYSMYINEIYDNNQLDLLKSNILTLSGVCSIFMSSMNTSSNQLSNQSNKISKIKLNSNNSNNTIDNYKYSNLLDAENSFRESLKLIKSLGLDNDIVSCELYNSIAQLMIMKYKYFNENKKNKCNKLANKWFNDYIEKYVLSNEDNHIDNTKENDNEIVLIKEKYNNIINSIRKQYNTMIGKTATAHSSSTQSITLTNIEAHHKAKNIIIKEKYKELLNDEDMIISKLLDVGYKYLIRSYDIIETTYNNNIYHPMIATTCLAIASIKNINKEYNISREWLIRSLRIMEKVSPTPYRAIAFIQIQLGYVMSKQGYIDETINILIKSLNFHKNIVKDYFISINRELGQSQYLLPSVTKQWNKYNSIYDDLYTTMSLSNRLIQLYNKKKIYYDACNIAKDVDYIIELAFGWDSVESAESKRQCGIQYAAISDWNNSIRQLKQSYDIYCMLYNPNSSYYKDILELLEFANEKKIDTFLEASDSVINPKDKVIEEENGLDAGTIDDFNYEYNFENDDNNTNKDEIIKDNQDSSNNDINKDINNNNVIASII